MPAHQLLDRLQVADGAVEEEFSYAVHLHGGALWGRVGAQGNTKLGVS
jgi:hypothetical protein